MKQYKGQVQVVDGNMAAASIGISKIERNSVGNIKYLGECGTGTPDSNNKHFITQLYYDTSLNFIGDKVATNRRYTGATDITVNITNPEALITCTGANFNEANLGDTLYFTTVTNTEKQITIKEVVSDTSVRATLDTSSGLSAETATVVASTDLILTLNHESTKDYNKRRWDSRDYYIYE
jgi:hypothetical protein